MMLLIVADARYYDCHTLMPSCAADRRGSCLPATMLLSRRQLAASYVITACRQRLSAVTLLLMFMLISLR